MESHRPSKRVATATAEEEDRLSALPDDLLHSILRSVPLKHAVRTGALSRRWPRLWLHALAASPVLDFGNRDFARSQPPAQAAATVRRCLRLHAKRGASLEAFRLAFRSPAGGFKQDVVAWVAAALARGAGEVVVDLTPTRWRKAVDDECGLDIDESAFLELPADLFMAQNSLTSLALVRCSLRAVPPSAAGFAGIRSLSLSHVDIDDWPLRDVIANLVLLEFLSLRSCNLLLHVKVAGEKLRGLELVSCLAVRDIWIIVPVLESFTFHGDVSYFGTCDSLMVYFRDTPAVRDAYLSHLGFSYTDDDEYYDWHCFAYYSLLNCVARATILTVCSVGLKHIDAVRAAALTMDVRDLQHSPGNQKIDVVTRPSGLTMDMPNLQELQLLMPALGGDDVDSIIGFFEFTRPPILDRLFIHLPVGCKRSRAIGGATVAALPGEDEDDADTNASTNQDLILAHLKFIKVVNFGGTRCEVRLLSFLMDSAPALEQLVLVTVEEEQGTQLDVQMKAIQQRVLAMRTAEACVTVCLPSEDGCRNPVHSRFYHEE